MPAVTATGSAARAAGAAMRTSASRCRARNGSLIRRSPSPVLSPRRVALHAARICGGAAAAAVARGGGEPALAPVGVDLDDVPAPFELLHGLGRQPALDHEHAGPRGARPERDREMLRMPGRRVDRFLQVHFSMNVPQKELRGPLVLLIATWRAPRQIRLAVA